MTPERWRRISAILHAALARHPADRGDLLSNACADDAPLRDKVESLIAAHERAGQFGDTPLAMPTALLRPGTSIGPYWIQQLLGAGGMGEVYRARDPRLGRDVAIKVLPSHLTVDPQRLAKFEREAQVLASLNHPNIGAIYGLEEFHGARALVMELVEGQDLAARVAHKPMRLADALPIARQIAEALEAAHDKGIIHRDLKPGNIRVRDDGTVKVLDFGLAKVVDSAARRGDAVDSPGLAVDPTEVGLVVGTPAHMSPEQACGKPADTRTDIWAFGVVLYEMLTARPLYAGETASEVLARVIEREPDLAALGPVAPPAIRALIGRCLTKDPRNRLQAIGEARIAIERVMAAADPARALDAGSEPLASAPRPLLQLALLVAVIAIVAAGGFVFWAPWRTTMSIAPLRLSTELGIEALLAIGRGDALALSPDGRVVAFVARERIEERAHLYIRRLGELKETDAIALPGTEGAESPFFSPDGEQIAFFAGGKLKRIPVAGGTAVTLCDAPNGGGGTWGKDGTIVFAPDLGHGVVLWRVSSAGGPAEPLLSLGAGEWGQGWPQLLPEGGAVLYTAKHVAGDVNDASLVIQPLPSGPRKVVHRGGYHGRYLPSGHLVYMHDGVLVAVSFDLDELKITGEPTPLLEPMTSTTWTGSAQFAVSETGTLVYLPGQTTQGHPLHWMDRLGTTTPLWATPGNWFNIRFAPDGRRIAMEIHGGTSFDIWLYEWELDRATPLTRNVAYEGKAVWTPDGHRIAFTSNRNNSPHNIYWQRADGTGDAQRLTNSTRSQWPVSWHPNGKFLAFEEHNLNASWDRAWDVMILPMEGDDVSGWKPGTPRAFANSPSEEMQPNFSPDGRWLAYQSNETGRDEVYVRPFPGHGDGWRVSIGGGAFPTWSRTRPELFYGLNGQIMVAAYTVEGDAFRAEKPRIVPNVRYTPAGPARMFDLHPDGERWALAPTEEARKHDRVAVIVNFFDELRRIAPATHN